MARGIARCGDLFSGICCCENGCVGMTGVVVTCSSDVITNNRGTARLGDVVIGICGHPGLIITSSSTVNANNRGIARLSDAVGSGCLIGILITASGNSFTG
jgi:uncharacterized Zn-binding protein involved in type VI secretion